MNTETDREALALYPFDGSDPNLIIALHTAFRAGAEFAAGHAPAPVPAPSVVPEAAVERAARAMQAENTPRPDPLNRDQREEQDDATIATYRTLARTGLTAALPLLTAAPSVTREAVVAVIFEADVECVLEVHEVRSLASRLLARFTITPKEDR